MTSKTVFAVVLAAAGLGQGLASGQEGPLAGSFWGVPQPVALGVDSEVDADRDFQQTVVFRPRAREKYAAWRISILDSSDRLVQKFSSAAAMPARLAWLGVGLDSRVVPDGFYHARLELTTGDGNVKSSDVEFSFMQPPDLARLNRQPLLLTEDDAKIVIRLPKLVYDSGSAKLSTEAEAILGTAADFLKDHPRSPAYVLGYTDNRGSAEINENVSRERAFAVYSFLVDHDVSPERLRYKGLGFRNPITSNGTEEGRLKNRRVEIWMSKTRVIGA